MRTQVDCGKGPAWELLDLSAGLEATKIDGGKSQLLDQLRHSRLCARIRARHEHHTVPARLAGITRKDSRGQRVERLHHAGTR